MMSSRTQTVRIALLALAAALIAGCASGGRVVDEWVDPEHTTQHGKVLVLAVRYGGPYQEMAENELIKQLRAGGLQTVARQELFRAAETLDAEKVRRRLADTDIDAVLVVSVGPISTSARGQPGLLSAPRGGLGDFDDEIGYVLSMGGNVPGNYRGENVEVDVITKLYAVETALPVWQAVIRTENPGSPGLLISKVSGKIAKSLKASGLVTH